MVHLVHKWLSAYDSWLSQHAAKVVERLWSSPDVILRVDRWQ
jgi:hypothetical protein